MKNWSDCRACRWSCSCRGVKGLFYLQSKSQDRELAKVVVLPNQITLYPRLGTRYTDANCLLMVLSIEMTANSLCSCLIDEMKSCLIVFMKQKKSDDDQRRRESLQIREWKFEQQSAEFSRKAQEQARREAVREFNLHTREQRVCARPLKMAALADQ